MANTRKFRSLKIYEPPAINEKESQEWQEREAKCQQLYERLDEQGQKCIDGLRESLGLEPLKRGEI